MVAEDCLKWAIFLPSLGYQFLKIHVPAMIRKFQQGCTLSGAKWLPNNQARRISNLQDSIFFVSCSPSFSDSYGEEVSIGIVRHC